MRHKVQITNGKIEPLNAERFGKDLELYEGKAVEISIKKWKDKRTLSQNSLYWRILELIENETGNDKDTLHDYFKIRFLDKRRLKLGDDEKILPGSTRKLDTREMGQYIDKIILFASQELQIAIPAPDYMDF